MKLLKKQKVLLLLVVVIISALVVFAGCQPQSPDKQDTPQQNNAEPTAAPQPQEEAPSDSEGFTRYTIKKQLGEKSKGGKDRIRTVNVEGSGNESMVTIELNGNDAYTADMTVRGMLMDSKKLLEPLSKRQDIKKVSISEYLDVEDIGGGTVEEWVFTISLDRKGLDKVAGGDYLLNDLTTMADEYKIHPNFK